MKLTIVPASRGGVWVALGMRTFFKQPLALAGLFFMFMALMSVASVVPVVGLPMAMTLLPATTLGLMVASLEASKGKFPMPLILLTAFRAGPAKSRAMVILGVLYASGFLCAMGVSYLVDGGDFARMYLGGQVPSKELIESSEFMAAMFTFIGLHLPLSLLFWHAPALVFWQDLSPAKALFFSIVACGRNFSAFCIFAVVWMAAMILMVFFVTAVVGLLGSAELVGTLLFPAILLMASMFFTSLYFTYRDCFEPTAAPLESNPL